jgi:predicted Zn-dependent peptidase
MSRRFALLALILLAAPVLGQSPAPPAPSPAPLQVPFRQFQLANGLNVILHQDKTVPVATVNIWYHVGSANEKPGRTGFAHLFEHLMFEGSKHVKEGQFDTLLESAGANNNASTANDRTNYYIDVPVERARPGAVPRFRSHGVSPRRDASRTGQ